MKKITVITLLLFGSISISQCKFSINEKDKFSGVENVETKRKSLYVKSSSFVQVAFGKLDSLNYILTKISTQGYFFISPKNNFVIIFDDDTKMILNVHKSTGVSSGGATTVLYANFFLSDEQLDVFQIKTVSSFRIQTSNKWVEGDVKTKNGNTVKEIANCI